MLSWLLELKAGTSVDARPNVTYVTAHYQCVITTTTTSCFLTNWQSAERKTRLLSSALQQKPARRYSRRRRANWCSARVETKVMSLPGNGGDSRWDALRDPLLQPEWPPLLHPGIHSLPRTYPPPQCLRARQLKYWMCLRLQPWQRHTLFHIDEALGLRLPLNGSPTTSQNALR